MESKRNILAGNNKFNFYLFIFFIYFFLINLSFAKDNTEGTFTDLKILDKISSKNTLVKLKNGEEIPIFAEDRRRFQRGVLGEYALYFAPDYMIHGTLFEVNLGKSITHGCVRLGAEDLRYLYEQVDVGCPVYIY